MKNVFSLFVGLFIFSVPAIAEHAPSAAPGKGEGISVDGKRYCREVVSDGLFGQPKGKRLVCVSFKDGKMTDDSHTFFGSPPETVSYRISGKQILVKRDGEWKAEFKLENGVLVESNGNKFEETLDLEGKTFCRTIISDGLFGQPKGERHHCVKFQEGVMSDNSNSFFGNPPESFRYKVEGKKIFLWKDGKWAKSEYSVDGANVIYNKIKMTESKKDEE